MDKLLAFLMISLILYGHITLLIEGHVELAPKLTQYRPYGFASLWIDGRFIKYLDLR